jgi:HAD superfamily hydrolase (TIGR01509 family)
MDGVIIDSEPLLTAHLIKYFNKMNLAINMNSIKHLIGVSSKVFWTKLKELYSLPNSIEFYVQDAQSSYLEYLKSINDLKPINGVIECIDKMNQNGLLTALATSGSKMRMNTVLDLLKMQNCFEVKVSAQDVLNAKPDPELFYLSAKLMFVEPDECIVIEDSKNGVTAAKRAGMKCIGFKQNENNQDLSNADFIVSVFDESLLKKILSL